MSTFTVQMYGYNDERIIEIGHVREGLSIGCTLVTGHVRDMAIFELEKALASPKNDATVIRLPYVGISEDYRAMMDDDLIADVSETLDWNRGYPHAFIARASIATDERLRDADPNR